MSDQNDMIRLPGSAFPAIVGAIPVGGRVADRIIDVSIWLRRRPSAKPLPDVETADFKPLTHKDFAEGWGASKEDAEHVLQYLKGVDDRIKQLPDTPSSPMLARRLVTVRGPLGAFARAFDATVQAVRLSDGRIVLERTGTIAVPKSLQGVVLSVFGLDTRPIGSPVRTPVADKAMLVSAEALPTPPQIAELYEFPKPPDTTKGEVIALMHFGGGYDEAHTTKYFDDLGVQHPTLVDVPVLTGGNSPGSIYDKEVTLDIEVAGSVAEEATLVNYFAPHDENGWMNAISTVVQDMENCPSVMSISWGAAELGKSNTLIWTADGMQFMSEQFADAAELGITVLAAAGNHGSDCKMGYWKAHVNYPASDPNVLACGGTMIADFANKPNEEIAWEFGGGGISDVYPVPAYQNADDLPMSRNTMGKARGVPDIAGYASPGYLFWIGYPEVLQGTSLVAPLYAAAVARRNKKVGSRAGFLHPTLYANSALFRDIDDPVSNSTSNEFNGAPGYYGRTGWDARTGLGVLEPGA
ncbi:MAG: hypothetical protein GEV13_13710 [Rhodospirillales bacterium]|nr:hypothetical protein [Rhodospirillales bacterium]